MDKEPLGNSKDEKARFLKRDLADARGDPASDPNGVEPEMFKKRYANILRGQPDLERDPCFKRGAVCLG